MPVSNPSTESEPFPPSNPLEHSEPSWIRNPSMMSEPRQTSNPGDCSEPGKGSNPSSRSEPLFTRNPSFMSEPPKARNPLRKSEPKTESNPTKSSEPEIQRNPQAVSEPVPESNPLGMSEPKNASKPEIESALWRGRIRALIEIYYDSQDVRIRSFNRLRQVGDVRGINPNLLKELEKQIRDYIKEEVHDLPIVKTFLRDVKGIGPILAGGLIAYFDPHKAPHVSSFWKYAGLSVEEGRAVRREKGRKTEYNPAAKVLCWKIADSFVKCRSPLYRPIYDQAKPEEAEKLHHPEEDPKNCPDYERCQTRLAKASERKGTAPKKLPCKKHIDYRARRKMVKRFLANLWAVWRRLEGLPVTEPYVVAVLGHTKDLGIKPELASFGEV